MKSLRARILLMGMFLTIAKCQVSAGEPPRLIIFISVDQMREDYFDRFAP